MELLDSNVVEAVRCGACEKQLYVSIMECEACGHEAVFSWGKRPDAAQWIDLCCPECHRPYNDRGADIAA